MTGCKLIWKPYREIVLKSVYASIVNQVLPQTPTTPSGGKKTVTFNLEQNQTSSITCSNRSPKTKRKVQVKRVRRLKLTWMYEFVSSSLSCFLKLYKLGNDSIKSLLKHFQPSCSLHFHFLLPLHIYISFLNAWKFSSITASEKCYCSNTFITIEHTYDLLCVPFSISHFRYQC